MGSEYLDNFFRDGSLRLPSFVSFRKHPDECRRDEQEGRAAGEISGPNGTLSYVAFNGKPAYILCASTVEPTKATPPNPKRSFFRINDTVGFADAVSRQIPGFTEGMEGYCIYREDILSRKSDPRAIKPPTGNDDAAHWSEEIQRCVGEQLIEAFFIKRLQFAHEAEYRLIWLAEGVPKEFIDLKCPGAIKYCERL
jgi:hypothetical protein